MSRKASIILTSVVGVVAGLWLWSGLIPKDAISIGGSTSVDPLMQLLTNEYKDSEGKDADSFVYSSSGSNGGVNSVQKGTYKIGFISKTIDSNVTMPLVDPKENKFDDSKIETNYDWRVNSKDIKAFLNKFGSQSQSLHYVHIADDAIIMVYNPPKDFSKWLDDFKLEFNINIDSWKDMIVKIYTGKANWKDIAEKISNGNDEAKGKIPNNLSNVPVKAFSREAGSGTRTTFDNTFGLANKNIGPLAAGEYNSNGMISANLIEGSLGYVSLNYLQTIKDNGKRVIEIDGNNPWEWHLDNASDLKEKVGSYNLKRPYIGLIRNDLSDELIDKISKFLGYMSIANVKDEKAAEESAKKDHPDDYKKYINEIDNVKQQYEHAYLVPRFEIDVAKDNVNEQNPPKGYNSKSSLDQTISSLKITIKVGYVPKEN